MERDKEYVISGAYKTQTKYGNKIFLMLHNSILYLPARVLSLGDEAAMKSLHDENESTLFKLELKQILPTEFFYSPYTA